MISSPNRMDLHVHILVPQSGQACIGCENEHPIQVQVYISLYSADYRYGRIRDTQREENVAFVESLFHASRLWLT